MLGQRAELAPYADIVTATGAPHSRQQAAWTHTGLAEHLEPELADRLALMLRGGAAETVQIRSLGGAINDVPEEATVYAHRHQNFSITVVARRNRSALDAAWDDARPWMDGIYLSFESDHTPARVFDTFPPVTLKRLREPRRKWDPDGIFAQNFDVTAILGEVLWVPRSSSPYHARFDPE